MVAVRRLSAVAAQESELAALRGQNRSRVAYLLRKAQAEKEEFDAALRRYQATRAVYAKQCRELLDAVAVSRFRFELTDVRHQMEMAAFSSDLKERIEQFFERVFALVDRAQAKAKEIHEMLTAMMRQLEVEHGIDCRPPAPLDFAAARASLETARTLALRQLASWGTMLVHTKSGVIERFLSLVASEVQHRWEAMHREAATWVRQALLPLEAALKEKKTELELRMNGIVRVTSGGRVAGIPAGRTARRARAARAAAAAARNRAAAGPGDHRPPLARTRRLILARLACKFLVSSFTQPRPWTHEKKRRGNVSGWSNRWSNPSLPAIIPGAPACPRSMLCVRSSG